MQIHNALGFPELVRAETGLVCQLNEWREPELGFTIGVSDVYMHSRLFAGKKEKPKRAFTNYCG